MKKIKPAIALLLVALFFAGCAASAAGADATAPSSETDSAPSGGNYFYAAVTDTESDFGGILVVPEDETLGGELVVHSENMPDLEKGDRVKVVYDGQIALSYPGQIFGAKVIPQK